MSRYDENEGPRRRDGGTPLDERPVELNTDLSNVVVVDNIPVVTPDKFEKLSGLLQKIFGGYGKILQFFIPQETVNNELMTVGYAFFEYENADQAARAVAEGDNKKLDKQHTFRVNLYTDFEKYEAVPPVFEFKMEDYEQKVDIKSWLLDENLRDQYVLRFGTETEVWWNDPQRMRAAQSREAANRGEAHKATGKHWTELYVAWSPKGSYFATFHPQGIVVWGGEQFDKLSRFAHSGVKLLDFSPNENYLVTCNANPEDPECVIVWDIRTGKKLRGFDSVTPSWPAFRWSHDDKYIARIAKDKSGQEAIYVYLVPEMGLLDKASIKVPGARDLQWSPTENYLSYWIPEHDNIPAKVSLIEIPTRRMVRERHLYNVADIKTHWHNQGDYLCVKMSRVKKGKVVSTNFEVFRMRTKEIPIEVLELEDNIIAFAWEPNGHRFAIIHEISSQNNVSFYAVKKKKMELLKTLNGKAANCLYWSPTGGQIVLAGLGTLNGQLEFFDVDMMETVATREHYMCTDVEWDPSGRFVMTCVCQPLGLGGAWRYAMENGYRIWAYDGKGDGVWAQRTTLQLDSFYQGLWRPRPASLLNKEQKENIAKSLRDKYWKKFEQEDEKLSALSKGEAERRRLDLKESWKSYRSERAKEHKEEAADRIALRNGDLSDDENDYETIDELVEQELSEEVTVIDAPRDRSDRDRESYSED